ncbi:hypothetical protein [Micromonospora sp. NBS 11-29]|uniref:hypothetical protein n=1 Tax=Micromonospora sp. NBS 11-29 TaxID=1960879 RepID=UPI000B77901C|nr:hypothetical protein [Micromonospora sp. NBS 11-29]
MTRSIATPLGSSSDWPAGRLVVVPFTTRRVPSHSANLEVPILSATDRLTEVLGQFGAPDTLRVCTSNAEPACASTKSPVAWKS